MGKHPERSQSIPPPPPPLPEDGNLDEMYGDIANNSYSNNYIADDQSVEAQHVVYTFNEDGDKKSAKAATKKRWIYLMVTVFSLLTIILALGIVYGKQVQARKKATKESSFAEANAAEETVTNIAVDTEESDIEIDEDIVLESTIVDNEDVYETASPPEGDSESESEAIVLTNEETEVTNEVIDEVVDEVVDEVLPAQATPGPTNWWQNQNTQAPTDPWWWNTPAPTDGATDGATGNAGDATTNPGAGAEATDAPNALADATSPPVAGAEATDAPNALADATSPPVAGAEGEATTPPDATANPFGANTPVPTSWWGGTFPPRTSAPTGGATAGGTAAGTLRGTAAGTGPFAGTTNPDAVAGDNDETMSPSVLAGAVNAAGAAVAVEEVIEDEFVELPEAELPEAGAEDAPATSDKDDTSSDKDDKA